MEFSVCNLEEDYALVGSFFLLYINKTFCFHLVAHFEVDSEWDEIDLPVSTCVFDYL